MENQFESEPVDLEGLIIIVRQEIDVLLRCVEGGAGREGRELDGWLAQASKSEWYLSSYLMLLVDNEILVTLCIGT